MSNENKQNIFSTKIAGMPLWAAIATVVFAGAGTYMVVLAPINHKAPAQFSSQFGDSGQTADSQQAATNQPAALAATSKPASGVVLAAKTGENVSNAPAVPKPAVIAPPSVGGASDSPAAFSATAPAQKPSAVVIEQSAETNKQLDELIAGQKALNQTLINMAKQSASDRQGLAEKLDALLMAQMQDRQAKIAAQEKAEAVRRYHRAHAKHHAKAKPNPTASWRLMGATEGGQAAIADSAGVIHVVHAGDTLDGVAITSVGNGSVVTPLGSVVR